MDGPANIGSAKGSNLIMIPGHIHINLTSRIRRRWKYSHGVLFVSEEW